MPTSSSSHPGARPRAQAVTTAPRSQDEDRGRRMRNYLVAMGIRTACFPLAVWAYTAELYAVAWVAALGAIFIPSFAVMLANAVDRRQVTGTDTISSPVQALGPGRDSSADGSREGRGETDAPRAASTAYPIEGTVVSRRDTRAAEEGPR